MYELTFLINDYLSMKQDVRAKQDVRVTYAQLEGAIGISSGTIRIILPEKLFLSKVEYLMMAQRDKNEARMTWFCVMLVRFEGKFYL